MTKNKKKSFAKVNIERHISSGSDDEQKIKSLELKRPPILDVSDISIDSNTEVDLPNKEINTNIISNDLSKVETKNGLECVLLNIISKIEEQTEKENNKPELIEQIETSENNSLQVQIETKVNNSIEVNSETKDNNESEVIVNETINLEVNNETKDKIELKEIELTNQEEEIDKKNTGCSKKWCSIL